MSLNRTRPWLTAGGLVLLMALPASAQDLRTMELFQWADISSYGIGPQPKEGYFFVFDGLFWHISKPDSARIGSPGATYSTSQLRTRYTEGNRFDLGRVHGHHGWLLSVYDLQNLSQTIPSGQGDVLSQVDTWSVEVMYFRRTHQFHPGGFLELFVGGRYLQFDDNFQFDEDFAVPNWSTEAQNHIVGPQLGIRWFKKRDRWTLSAESRFLAGLNVQNIRQQGTEFDHAHMREWSPVTEFRANARYQLTRAISFRVGWTGIYMDGIARASNMIDYTRNEVLTSQNRQDAFIHGLTIGLDVNR